MTTALKQRATEFFAGRQTRAGVVARRLLGTSSERDAVLTDHLIREQRQRSRMDGSTDGSLLKTAWAVLELVQLDSPPDHAAMVRAGGWLLARQGQAGRFGEDCTDARHTRGLCHHFLPGFFSPAGADVALAPLTFPSGMTVRDESEARFAVSCFALRALLRARQEKRQGLIDHVLSLLNLGEVWGGWGGPWSGDVVLMALGAIAPAPLEYRERVERLTTQVAKKQRADGTWEGADTIHALDVMLSIPTFAAQAAARKTVPRIAALAGDNALFTDETEERSLIALRAVLAA